MDESRISITLVGTINELCWCLYVKAHFTMVQGTMKESLWPPFTVRTKTAFLSIWDCLLRSFVPPFALIKTQEVPIPYCFAVAWVLSFTGKIFQSQRPCRRHPWWLPSCSEAGRGSSFRWKDTRSGGWGSPGEQVQAALLPALGMVIFGPEGIWRMALPWWHTKMSQFILQIGKWSHRRQACH